jgi:signal peptidase I
MVSHLISLVSCGRQVRVRAALHLEQAGSLDRVRQRLARLGVAGIGLVGLACFTPWRTGVVMGRSMMPTLPPHSIFLYDRRYSRSLPLQRGVIIVVRVRGELWVKRVYALGGESFWALRQVDKEGVRLEPIRSSQLRRFRVLVATMRNRMHHNWSVVRVRVPPRQVFLVGDGAWSRDSRDLGPVSTRQILGRVVAWPGTCLPPAPRSERSFPTRRDVARYQQQVLSGADCPARLITQME